MSNVITANELKTKGIAAIRNAVASDSEAIISNRGKGQYVVMRMQEYNRLRECELEAAILESRGDIKSGKFHQESVQKHLKRISDA